jgi:hypothetical protein
MKDTQIKYYLASEVHILTYRFKIWNMKEEAKIETEEINFF